MRIESNSSKAYPAYGTQIFHSTSSRTYSGSLTGTPRTSRMYTVSIVLSELVSLDQLLLVGLVLVVVVVSAVSVLGDLKQMQINLAIL